MTTMRACVMIAPMLVLMAGGVARSDVTSEQSPFDFREVMVPMRDGTKLQTAIMTPKGRGEDLPILLRRSPYGVSSHAPFTLADYVKPLMADGYIFVEQNLRGRFKSEGKFRLADDSKLTPGEGTIETRDAYDTIDWLVNNVPHNNGRVGIFGVSYDGMTSAVTLLHPHPALKAVSEQASPVDQWMNDDFHRYGALRLSYAFEYAVLEEAEKNANTHFGFDTYDTYAWYLDHGTVANLNTGVLHGTIDFFSDVVAHPDYDSFWRSQGWISDLHAATVPTLNVAGFWDQEDPWGPWQIFRAERQSDPAGTALMVAGPWFHGGWWRHVSALGPIELGQDTSLSFMTNIQAPFFAYWLHGKGEKPAWAATMFETGSNTWKTYRSWPPADVTVRSLYFHNDFTLSFTPPAAADAGAHRDYVADPANPVPYRARPMSPTYPGGDWRRWESADQRFADHRPDVLTYVSAPLAADVAIAGPVSAQLAAASSGTDSDFVVKLIDVFPENNQVADWSDCDACAGPKPGEYAQSSNGYELPIAMEVRRGRYLDSYEHPASLTPSAPRMWDVPLRDRDHVFLRGHRIMVQVQSSWFPLIDRNPQTFVPNIAQASPADFKAATQSIYAAPQWASRILLPVREGR